MSSHMILFMLVVISMCNNAHALKVISSDDSALVGVNFDTPPIKPIGNSSFDTFNTSIFLVETTGCKDSKIPLRSSVSNMSSVTVFFTKMGGCYPDKKVINGKAAGYDAVLMVNDRGNLGLLTFYWHPTIETTNIPVIEILEDDTKLYLEGGNLQMVTIRDNDPNPWDNFNLNAFWPYSIIIGLIDLIILSLVIYKLWAFYTTRGFTLDLAMQVLYIELVSIMIRFIYVIDPHSIHHVIPWGVHEIFLTNTFTLSLDTNVLIMFYWLATLNKKDAGGPALDKFKWPCYIFIIVFTLFDFITSIMLGMMLLSAKIILIKGMVFIFTGLASAIMFIYTGTKVILKLRRTGAEMKGVKRLSIFILLTGICLLWFTGVSISVPFSFDTPISFYLINGLAFIATEFISLLEVLSLRAHRKGDSSRTGTTREMETKTF